MHSGDASAGDENNFGGLTSPGTHAVKGSPLGYVVHEKSASVLMHRSALRPAGEDASVRSGHSPGCRAIRGAMGPSARQHKPPGRVCFRDQLMVAGRSRHKPAAGPPHNRVPPSSAKEPRRRDKADDEQGAGDGLGSTRWSICNPGLPATGTLTLEAMRQINFAELSSANLLPARGTGSEGHRGRPDPYSRQVLGLCLCASPIRHQAYIPSACRALRHVQLATRPR